MLQVSVTMLTIKTPERRHWYRSGAFIVISGRNLLQVSVTMLTIKTPERRHWYRSGAFIVISEYVSLIVLVFPLLTLNK